MERLGTVWNGTAALRDTSVDGQLFFESALGVDFGLPDCWPPADASLSASVPFQTVPGRSKPFQTPQWTQKVSRMVPEHSGTLVPDRSGPFQCCFRPLIFSLKKF